MHVICDYCSKLIEKKPLTLECCGYTVCKEHYKDLEICLICSNKFDINECLSILKNQINLKNSDFQQQVEDFRIQLNDFCRLKANPEIVLAKHSITDDKINSWFLSEINSIQLDEIESKTNEFIKDTLGKIENIENKRDHFEMINRRVEILKEITLNLNLEFKLIRQLKKYELSFSISLLINKFVVESKSLITSSLNGEIRRLNSNLRKSAVITNVQSNVLCLILTSNKRIVYGLSNGTIQIWSRKKKKLVCSLNAHESKVLCLQELDSFYLASGSSDGEIKLWNLKTHKYCFSYEGHSHGVNFLEIVSDDKKLFASCSNDRTIKIWCMSLSKCLKTLSGHESSVNCLKLLNKNYLASGSFDGYIKIWNIEKGECVRNLNEDGDAISYMENLIFNKTLVVGTMSGRLKCWDWVLGFLNYSICDAHECSITCIKKYKKHSLITCSLDKTIKYWKINRN